MTPFLLGVAGWKNSGKTTLVAGLVRRLTARGLRIATVKHAHHPLDAGRDDADGARHLAAGAVATAVVGPGCWMLSGVGIRPGVPALDEVLQALPACDIVIAEGYKSLAHPKIECRRLAAADRRPLAGTFPPIVAIASDHPVADQPIPVFGLDDVEAIAAFVEALSEARESF